jgi:Uma2 family endonuclease
MAPDRGHRRDDGSAEFGAQWIARNLSELFNRAFEAQRRDLRAYREIAIRLPGLANFQPEPDVVVAPGTAGYELYADNFQLVAEILSPSNRRHEIELNSVVIVKHRTIFMPW